MDRLALYRFYHKMVLPWSVKGFFDAGHWEFNEELVDQFYKERFAVRMRLNDDGSSGPYVEDKKDMTDERLYRFVEQCLHFMREELKVNIDDQRREAGTRQAEALLPEAEEGVLQLPRER